MTTDANSIQAFLAALLTPIVQTAIREEFQRQTQQSVEAQPPVGNRIGGLELVKELTGYGDSTIYNKVSKGEMPVFERNGSKLLFSEAQLREWIRTGRPKKAHVSQVVDQFLGSRKGGRRAAA